MTNPAGERSLEAGLHAALVAIIGTGRAGITAFGDGLPCATWIATDEAFAELDDLQITFGEGPAVDARRSGTIVSEDLRRADSRWPGFVPGALDRGARAVLAVPLIEGPACLGVLTMYGDDPVDVHQRSFEIDRVRRRLTRLLLDQLSDTAPGALPGALDAAMDRHAVLHAATGTVVAQLAVAADSALSAIQMHAWATGREIHELAADIVAGTVRLDAEEPT